MKYYANYKKIRKICTCVENVPDMLSIQEWVKLHNTYNIISLFKGWVDQGMYVWTDTLGWLAEIPEDKCYLK